jgi:hypothetical protein
MPRRAELHDETRRVAAARVAAATLLIGLCAPVCPAQVGAPSVPIRSSPRSLLTPAPEPAPAAARPASAARGRVAGPARTDSGLRGVPRSSRPGPRADVAALDDSIRWHGIDAIEVGARVRTLTDRPDDPARRDVEALSRVRDTLAGAGADGRLVGRFDGAVQRLSGVQTLESARASLVPQGYREVELAPGDVAFIRGSEDDLRRFDQMRACIKAHAEPLAPILADPECDLSRRPGCDDEFSRRVAEGGAVEGSESGDNFVKYGSAEKPSGVPDAVRDPVGSGIEFLRRGDAKEAALSFADYLTVYPDDTRISRMLAVSLLLDGQVGAGVALLAVAYTSDSSLAAEPLGRDDLPWRSDMVGRAVAATIARAQRDGDARAWLAAAVLMQAQGRREPAAKMVDRALQCGLDSALARELKLALKR